MESDAGWKNSACSTNTVGMEFCSTSASASPGILPPQPKPYRWEGDLETQKGRPGLEEHQEQN